VKNIVFDKPVNTEILIRTRFQAAVFEPAVSAFRTRFSQVQLVQEPMPGPQLSFGLEWAPTIITFVGLELVKKFLGGIFKEGGIEDFGGFLMKSVTDVFKVSKKQKLYSLRSGRKEPTLEMPGKKVSAAKEKPDIRRLYPPPLELTFELGSDHAAARGSGVGSDYQPLGTAIPKFPWKRPDLGLYDEIMRVPRAAEAAYEADRDISLARTITFIFPHNLSPKRFEAAYREMQTRLEGLITEYENDFAVAKQIQMFQRYNRVSQSEFGEVEPRRERIRRYFYDPQAADWTLFDRYRAG